MVLETELIVLSFGLAFCPACADCHHQGVRVVATSSRIVYAACMLSIRLIEIVLGAELIMLSFGVVLFLPVCAHCHQQEVSVVATS